MENINYKKNIIFYVLVLCIALEFFTFLALVVLDTFSIGRFKELNALKGGFVFLILACITYMYTKQYNFIFNLNALGIQIIETSNFKKREHLISYSDIRKIDHQMLSKKLKIHLKNNNEYIIKFMHKRVNGAISDESKIGNSFGSLRELANLKTEIEKRVKIINE